VDRQVVHQGAVHPEPALDLAWREEAGQGARREDGVRHLHVREAGQAPEDLHAAVDLDRRDDEPPGQVGEGEVAEESAHEVVERLGAVQRGRAHPLERHVGVRDVEDVSAPQAEREIRDVADAVARRPRRGDERADAGADDLLGHPAVRLELREGPDVREAAQAAAAEHEREARRRRHRSLPRRSMPG